jgi:hypothetical protein
MWTSIIRDSTIDISGTLNITVEFSDGSSIVNKVFSINTVPTDNWVEEKVAETVSILTALTSTSAALTVVPVVIPTVTD